MGLDHFMDSLQKWILEAAIDRLEIQSWLKGEIVPNWISILEAVNDKMFQTCVNSENGLGSHLKL